MVFQLYTAQTSELEFGSAWKGSFLPQKKPLWIKTCIKEWITHIPKISNVSY